VEGISTYGGQQGPRGGSFLAARAHPQGPGEDTFDEEHNGAPDSYHRDFDSYNEASAPYNEASAPYNEGSNPYNGFVEGGEGEEGEATVHRGRTRQSWGPRPRGNRTEGSGKARGRGQPSRGGGAQMSFRDGTQSLSFQDRDWAAGDESLGVPPARPWRTRNGIRSPPKAVTESRARGKPRSR